MKLQETLELINTAEKNGQPYYDYMNLEREMTKSVEAVLDSEKANEFDEYDTFDVALALYHWLQHNWQGHSDHLYAAFNKLGSNGVYRPAKSEEFFQNIDDNVRDIYDQLTMDNYRDALSLVLNYEASE